MSHLVDLKPEDREATAKALRAVYNAVMVEFGDLPDDTPVAIGEWMGAVADKLGVEVLLPRDVVLPAGEIRKRCREGFVELGELPDDPLSVIEGERRR